MKKLSKPLLYAFLGFFAGAIMTYLSEPKTVELKGAILGGAKFAIIVFVLIVVTENISFFNKRKE